MTQINNIRFLAFALVCSFAFLPGCKKNSGNTDNPNSTFYFQATVSGKSFNANFVSPTDGGPGIAATTVSNGVTYVVAFGIQILNTNDSSLFLIVFPSSTPLNTATSLSPSVNTGIAYTVEASPGSPDYYTYGTNPAYGGSGTFTVTEFDQAKKIVAGTFSATLGSSTGSTVNVTNGKFNCTLVSSTNSFPPNVKF